MPLSVSDSPIKVYNAALTRLGLPKISDFTGKSIAERTGNEMYEDVLESALCMYPWRFATRRVSLTRLAETAPAPYEGLYSIPAEIIHVWQVYEDDDASRAWDLFERTVAVNVSATQDTSVSVDGAFMVGPASWPGYFRLPFITYLAANVAMPLTQDARIAEGMMNLAQMQLAKAASRDSQSRTPSRVDTKTFIRARRGGRY